MCAAAHKPGGVRVGSRSNCLQRLQDTVVSHAKAETARQREIWTTVKDLHDRRIDFEQSAPGKGIFYTFSAPSPHPRKNYF